MPPNPTKSLVPAYWSLFVITALAGMLVIVTFWIGARAESENDWSRHSLEVRNRITQIMSLIQRAETTQRGYLLTGRERYLEPYAGAAAALPDALDQLNASVADNSQQQQSVAKLRETITAKLNEMNSTLAEQKAGRPTAALAIVETDEGLGLMRDIRQLLSTMDKDEDRLFSIRQANAASFGRLVQAGAASVFLMICAIGALTVYFTRRSVFELSAAHDRLLEQVNRREEVESQLRQSQKMESLGQLTGGIAHDFNNMLGVIVGSLDLMQRRIKSGDFGIERFVESARKATDRAATLTHRLLAFARQQPLAPEQINANRKIADMSDLLRSTLGEQIKIETVLAGGLWMTNTDAHQLENAILNIAINARDAMPEGGSLTIETANAYLDEAYCKKNAEVQPGQYVMIAISDTGAGMKPEVSQRAFDPFFTTKPAGKGTGLGLSQVYGFIKQSRGHISIYSEIGAGTAVKIYLPRYLGGTTVAESSAAQPMQTGAANEVILVVEDDPLVGQLTTENLRELGYTVLNCESAVAALRLIESRPDIKLVFTDVVMPEMNGRKLADEVLRRWPGIKVVFTTGYTSNAVVHGGVLDAGVNFIGKPFTSDQLASKIRTVLDS